MVHQSLWKKGGISCLVPQYYEDGNKFREYWKSSKVTLAIYDWALSCWQPQTITLDIGHIDLSIKNADIA